MPTPCIELRVLGRPQVQIPVVTHQLKQEPDLFLAFVMAARIAADISVRHLVAQPVSGAGHNANVLLKEPHFFVQFTNHGLFGGLTPVNATLRKLPRVCANSLAPKYLIFLVEQDDADVGPKAVPVKHNQTPIFKLFPLCTASAVQQAMQPSVIPGFPP